MAVALAVSAIPEGLPVAMTVDNVRKVTFLLISCGLAEVLLFTASLLFGLPIPLTAVQLLMAQLGHQRHPGRGAGF